MIFTNSRTINKYNKSKNMVFVVHTINLCPNDRTT